MPHITFIGGDYKHFLNSIKKLDLLIIDKEISIPKDLLFRVNNFINLTKIKISNNETKLLKPLKLERLLDIIFRIMRDEYLFCYLNDSWVYNERLSRLKSKAREITLTAKENELFAALLVAPNFTLQKDELKSKIWKYHEDTESTTVETHIYKLKQKLPEEIFYVKDRSCYLKISTS